MLDSMSCSKQEGLFRLLINGYLDAKMLVIAVDVPY